MAESDTRQVYLLWWRPQRPDFAHISQGKGFRNLWSLRQFLSFSDHANHIKTGWQKV